MNGAAVNFPAQLPTFAASVALRALLSYYCYQYYLNISLLSSLVVMGTKRKRYLYLLSSLKNTKNCRLKSLLFLSFLLFFFKTFYLKQRPPLLQDSVLALFTLGILPLPFLSRAGGEKKRRRKVLVHYFQTSEFRDARKAGNRRRQKTRFELCR